MSGSRSASCCPSPTVASEAEAVTVGDAPLLLPTVQGAATPLRLSPGRLTRYSLARCSSVSSRPAVTGYR